MKAKYSGFHMIPITFACVNYQSRDRDSKLNVRFGPDKVLLNSAFFSLGRLKSTHGLNLYNFVVLKDRLTIPSGY